MDVPEDAEIGTDGQGLALLAILGTNVIHCVMPVMDRSLLPAKRVDSKR
jgi:hypothetical protein